VLDRKGEAMIRLSEDEAADVLDLCNAGRGLDSARIAARSLMDLGYVLVAVSGPALDKARAEKPSYLPPADPDQIARLDQWCDPARTS